MGKGGQAASKRKDAAGAAAGSSKKPRKSQGDAAAPAEAAGAQKQQPARKARSTAKAKGAAAAAAPAAPPAAPAAKAAADKPPFYLVKSEPHEFSIQQLQQHPHQTEGWDGVRNAQARNFLRSMSLGDQAFFYHSSCKVPGIVGIVEVVREAYPDPSALDSASKYHDPKAAPEDPRWYCVDFKLVRELRRQITLEELKGHKEGRLAGMALFNRPRLSVQPVTAEQWDFVMSLEEQEGGQAAG